MKDHFIDYSLENAVKKSWKWKFWIAGSCSLVGVITLILAFRMPNEFKSVSAFVPPSFNSLNSMVYNQGISYRGFESAEEIDIDRSVAFLNSIQIKDSIAKKYSLYEHYGIKKENKDADKLFYFTYSKKVTVSYTDQSTIEIEIYDVNPKVASDIANEYLNFASGFFETISERKRGFQASIAELEKMREERVIILDSLSSIRTRYHIYHLDNMGQNVDRYLSEQMISQPDFHKRYDEVVSLEVNLKLLEERLSDGEREYLSRKLNLEQYPSLIQIVERGEPSSFKARPKRSLILLGAIIATFLFSIFVVLIVDREKEII